VALKLVYLAVSRMFAWATLAARDSAAKNVEIQARAVLVETRLASELLGFELPA
jgi:hypothetical protein